MQRSIALLALAWLLGAVPSALAGGLLAIDYEDADFDSVDPLIIDNPYWPLRPDGFTRTFTILAETEDECVVDQLFVGHEPFYDLMGEGYEDEFAVEVLDTEWVFEDYEECSSDLLMEDDADEAIKEETRDWYRQDAQQNIWYMGEHSQVFGEDGCPEYPGIGAPEECFEGSWEAGVAGGDEEEAVVGIPGIVVPGNEPEEGEPLTAGTFFMQEEAFEAEDMAKILRLDATYTVEDGTFAGDYDNCRKVKEWNPFEPGGSVEHKWYCHGEGALGPGLLLIESIGGGKTEVEVLVNIDPVLPAP